MMVALISSVESIWAAGGTEMRVHAMQFLVLLLFTSFTDTTCSPIGCRSAWDTHHQSHKRIYSVKYWVRQGRGRPPSTSKVPTWSV